MRNRVLVSLMCACTVAATVVGCGSGAGGNKTEAAQAEATTAEEAAEADTAEALAEAREPQFITMTTAANFTGEKYESEDGWSCRYDADLMEVNERSDAVEFIYTGESNGTNKLIVRYIPNTSTDLAIADALIQYDGERIERGEGYFGGRTDIWAFYADVIRNGWRNTVGFTAVEYNEGVLFIERDRYTEDDEEKQQQITDTINNTLGSFEFEDFAPQEEYDYIPGKYVLEESSLEGDTENYAKSVLLNADHTGEITIQDTVPIIWLARDGLIKEDYVGGESYYFSIEGEYLYLQQDGEWIEYHKKLGANTGVANMDASGRDPMAFATYENENGWLVYYDKRLFQVNESYNAVDFVYGESEDDTDKLRFSYEEDATTDEVLADIESDYDHDQIQRSEGYFGGGREAWGFTVTITEDSDAGRKKIYTAMEHNGGVLLVERTAHTSDSEEQTRMDAAFEEIASTFLFTEHDQPQEYDYIPGKYLLNDKILQKDASNYPKSVVLRDNHSGTMGDMDIVWYARDGILKEDKAGGKTYDYHFEGDTLYVDMDGEWVEFEREETDD